MALGGFLVYLHENCGDRASSVAAATAPPPTASVPPAPERPTMPPPPPSLAVIEADCSDAARGLLADAGALTYPQFASLPERGDTVATWNVNFVDGAGHLRPFSCVYTYATKHAAVTLGR